MQDVVFDSTPFEEDRASSDPVLLLEIDGFSGPLDLLLELARRQKVDLQKISILALADQYLQFIEKARSVLRLELAADYLVMAAWLAYLKSRLLLPEKAKPDEPDAASLADALALRLQRLEAIRVVAKKLEERAQLGRDVYVRGAPEPVVIVDRPLWEASLYDLLQAYAERRQTKALSRVTFQKRFVWSIPEAREALSRLLGFAPVWTSLDDYLISYVVEPAMRRTVRASALSATLEFVKEGKADVRQDGPFRPIYMRQRSEESVANHTGENAA